MEVALLEGAALLEEMCDYGGGVCGLFSGFLQCGSSLTFHCL